MALAQPTGLQVQALEPLVTFEQEVVRAVDTDVLVSEAGDVLATEDSRDLASERLTLISFTQVVDDSATLVSGGPLITFQQEVVRLSEVPAQTLITFKQSVERHVPGGPLIRFRQTVLSPAQIATSPTRITLDGEDITAKCDIVWSVTGAEGANRTANITIIDLPRGPLDITSYEGREVTISRLQDGVLEPLFSGVVDVPRYLRLPSRISLTCSDLRNERVGKHDREALKQMTGGLFSPITQRDDATGEQWVGELMRTVEGSLDYTGAGALRFRPWALGAPRYSLTGRDVYYRELETEFATRSDIRNKIRATLEYRWFQRNTIAHAVSLALELSDLCKSQGCWPASRVEDENGNLVPQSWPTRAAIRSAAESVSGWMPVALDYLDLPPDGWYRPKSDVTRKISLGANDVIRDTRCIGADITFERYISQAKREAYALTVEAPESIEQHGEIVDNDMRFAVESRIPPEIFEERGCSTGPADDRRADVELAIQAIQRMAAKKIRERHRGNHLAYRYHPQTGRPGVGQVLPVEIGDVVQISATEVNGVGFVTEFAHRSNDKGDIWTDLKLAVSRVDSSLSVTEDWTLPAAPASYKLTPPEPGQLETPDCPAPVGEVEIEGDSRIEPDGTVIIVAPAVDRSKVDEIQGTREHTYSVAIPKDQLSVEVI
ncbi:hypothetical protein QHH_31 [Halomonas phage QHHSV-1]|nr:hypothetical protein QHH_31 [Halomonas phage QHHSV-1]